MVNVWGCPAKIGKLVNHAMSEASESGMGLG